MTGLVRRSSSSAATPKVPVSAGGVSTAGISFDGTSPRWEDLPAHVRAAATIGGAQAAAEVDTGPLGTVRHRHDAYWQPWTVWVARRDGIALIRVRRLMTRLEGKKFKPTGELVVGSVEEHAAASPPSRRRATLSAPAGGSEGDSAMFSPGQSTGDEGLRTLTYLPAVVQQEVLTDVSSPSYSHGCLWELYSGSDLPYRQELAVLRLSGSSAVIVVASKEVDALPVGIGADAAQSRVAARPWDLTRYRYRLRDRVVRRELSPRE